MSALAVRDLWVELDGAEVLRGIDLELRGGETAALMGRNGAGKTTLLRTMAGLLEPARGSVDAGGEVALLPQNPGDLFVRERISDELPGEEGAAALAAVGLEGVGDVDPRDLSGGERQRLALAIVMAGRDDSAVVLFDEPTRGMDRGRKQDLARMTRDLAAGGAAVAIATHDVEFAAAFADRVVMLGDGEQIADGGAGELLSGGWYFATEVARVLAEPGIITPEQGASYLRGRVKA